MTNNIHATVEATPGPTFGGGYRVNIVVDAITLDTRHFPVPVEYRNLKDMTTKGLDAAYANAKTWMATYGCE
jgi:hypothetical protein